MPHLIYITIICSDLITSIVLIERTKIGPPGIDGWMDEQNGFKEELKRNSYLLCSLKAMSIHKNIDIDMTFKDLSRSIIFFVSERLAFSITSSCVGDSNKRAV